MFELNDNNIFHLTLSCLVSIKRSPIIKQTYIFQLQVSLSLGGLFVNTRY